MRFPLVEPLRQGGELVDEGGDEEVGEHGSPLVIE
jgi:hypothetical protein